MIAAAMSCAPTTLPANAIEPVSSRTCSSVDKPERPDRQAREEADAATKRVMPGGRKNAA